MNSPQLRDSVEINAWGDTYLTLHRRLRQFSIEPESMDLAAYVAACTWGSLSLAGLELVDGDLAIHGVRVDRVDYGRFRRVLSITQERHQAFNWLLGFEQVYSEVTTDT